MRRTHPTILTLLAVLVLTPATLFAVGQPEEEVTVEEAAELRSEVENEILRKTVTRPGPGEYELGVSGGTWTTTITNDPTTFNTLIARDEDTRAIIDPLFDYLADYDPYSREWTANVADFEIEVDTQNDKLQVVFTLRDDLYWTTPGQSLEEGVKITSDDVVFWYDEIDGDPDFQLPAYPGQFVDMPDGSQERITIEKIDDRSFSLNYPRIVANPILSSNMTFGPRHIYEPAKEDGGVEAVLDLLSVDTDPATIPSMGAYHIVEYTPGVRVVLQKNPNYWKTDDSGTVIPYVEEYVYRIVPDKDTEFLLFKDGTKEGYSLRPQDLDELLAVEDPDFTVFNGGESLGSSFFSFNQNPDTMDELIYGWFSRTEFRQAMSSLLNRGRIAEQVYRGLAEPAHYFFARANPMFDPDITLEYTYDPERAVELLETIDITRGDDGLMYDADGNHIEFEMQIPLENNISVDIANIFSDELEQVGITANVKPMDFPRIVEMLTRTYDWQVVLVGLGANYWPSGGSNVWQSSGNFHLWHPLQEEPATEWEARVDYLYNEGRFTIDPDRQKEIYDEYQRILLTQLPLMYVVHPLSFVAVRDRWGNVYYDTLGGLGGKDSDYIFLEELSN
jgi:peptide/nickel transport system substrate-binding protein